MHRTLTKHGRDRGEVLGRKAVARQRGTSLAVREPAGRGARLKRSRTLGDERRSRAKFRVFRERPCLPAPLDRASEETSSIYRPSVFNLFAKTLPSSEVEVIVITYR